MANEATARALQLLYAMLDDSDRLGLSRAARLQIVAVVGELEAAMGSAPPRPANPADEPDRRADR